MTSAQPSGASRALPQQGEMFGKPPICPKLPGRRSKEFRALLHLLAGEGVTQAVWLDLDGSWRLAASVEKLKNRLGWPIDSDPVAAPSPESPTRRIACYRMAAEGVEAGRELLRAARRLAPKNVPGEGRE
jgi:hypothetical protein